MAQPAPRYNNVAQHLQKLPPEVVHEILGDLSIMKLLEIVGGHDIPYIDQCILSHKELGKVFLQETLAEAKTCFIVYLRLCSLDYRSPHPKLTKLNFDAVRMHADHPNNPADFVVSIRGAVHIPHPSFWTPSSASDLQQVFEIIDAAEAKINAKKVEQLERMARLIQEFPSCLKRTHDHSQEPRRNEQHIVDALLDMARRMRRRQLLSGFIVGKSVFTSRGLHLVLSIQVLAACLKNTEENAGETPDGKSGTVHHAYPAEHRSEPSILRMLTRATDNEVDSNSMRSGEILTPFEPECYRRRIRSFLRLMKSWSGWKHSLKYAST